MNLLIAIDVGLSSGLIMAGAVMALAVAFRLFDFPDITVEGSFLIGAAVFGTLLTNDWPILVAVLSGLSAGALAGGLTALFYARFHVNKFLAAIIVITIAYSLSLRIMGRSNLNLLNEASLFDRFEILNTWLPGEFMWSVIAPVGLGAAFALVLLKYVFETRVGLRLRVASASPMYARTLGLDSGKYLIIGLAFTNAIAAWAGIMQATHQGFVDVGMGQGTLIVALAAMAIGERVMPQKAFSFHLFVMTAAVIGSIIYQILVAIALQLGLSATDLKLATGILVLAVVAFRTSREDDLLKETF